MAKRLDVGFVGLVGKADISAVIFFYMQLIPPNRPRLARKKTPRAFDQRQTKLQKMWKASWYRKRVEDAEVSVRNMLEYFNVRREFSFLLPPLSADSVIRVVVPRVLSWLEAPSCACSISPEF